MRQHNRLLAYVHEHAPDHDTTQQGYSVFKDPEENEWDWTFSQLPEVATVTMPLGVAKKLVKRLNNGKVVL